MPHFKWLGDSKHFRTPLSKIVLENIKANYKRNADWICYAQNDFKLFLMVAVIFEEIPRKSAQYRLINCCEIINVVTNRRWLLSRRGELKEGCL